MDHPAKFSERIVEVLQDFCGSELAATRKRSLTVLDPFAGVGLVHKLGVEPEVLMSPGGQKVVRPYIRTVGVELEPEWAEMHPRTVVGDATELPFDDQTFDAVVTSPTYGNRMADHHDARDGSVRHTYKHTLGRDLHPNNSGQMQWGSAYRELHAEAWAEVWRVLKEPRPGEPGTPVWINVSNHIRRGVEVPVAEWHLQHFLGLGAIFGGAKEVRTLRQRHGANRDLRVAREWIFEFRKVGQ